MQINKYIHLGITTYMNCTKFLLERERYNTVRLSVELGEINKTSMETCDMTRNNVKSFHDAILGLSQIGRTHGRLLRFHEKLNWPLNHGNQVTIWGHQ